MFSYAHQNQRNQIKGDDGDGDGDGFKNQIEEDGGDGAGFKNQMEEDDEDGFISISSLLGEPINRGRRCIFLTEEEGDDGKKALVC